MQQKAGDTTMAGETRSIPDGEAARPALKQPFRVGQWLVRPDLNELISQAGNGETRHLEPRLMHLLAYLAANPAQVLTRDALVQELWPRVIVNENSLTRAVSELRKQLHSDDLAGQHYIKTIPKRGYRLSAAVSVADDTAAQARPDSTASESETGLLAGWLPRMTHTRTHSTAAAACLSLVLGAWLLAGPVQQEAHGPMTGTLSDQLVNSNWSPEGGEFQLSAGTPNPWADSILETPVISADRQRYAYVARESMGFAIYVGEMGSEAAQPVKVFECGARMQNLTWSPTGNALLFAQPSRFSAASLMGASAEAVLLRLDLDDYSVSRLVEDRSMPNAAVSTKSSLT